MRISRRSSRMCRSGSSGAENILCLSKYVWANIGAHVLRRDDLDAMLEKILKEQARTHKVIKGLLIRMEFDEKVYVTIRSGFAA